MKKLTEIPITPREFDVLQLLGEGMTNKAIAQRLNLQPTTVKVYLQKISFKLGLHVERPRMHLAKAFAELQAAMPILQLQRTPEAIPQPSAAA